MWPVLFTIRLSAATAPVAALVAAVAFLALRTWGYVRAARAAGEPIGAWQALREDRVLAGLLVAGVAVVWRVTRHLGHDVTIPVHSYGLLIAAGFVAGIGVAQWEARRRGQDPERIGDLAVWILVAALVGSRIYFIAVNWRDYFVGDGAWVELGGVSVPRVLAFWQGGLVFYGGFIAAALTGIWYLRRHHMPILPYADTVLPSVSLGHFFGRLGCFGAGCCWGAISHAHVPWLVKFPPGALAYHSFASRPDAAALLAPDRLTTLPVHPTQLYEAFGELALFAILVLVVRPAKRFHGQVFAAWLMGYAVLRTVVELFRGDVERGVIAGLGVGQWTSIAIFAAGVLVWVIGRRRGALAPAADTVVVAG